MCSCIENFKPFSQQVKVLEWVLSFTYLLFLSCYQRIKELLGFIHARIFSKAQCVTHVHFTWSDTGVTQIQRRTTKQNQCSGQSQWYPNKDSRYRLWLTLKVCLWISVFFFFFACLAGFFFLHPLAAPLTRRLIKFALCHFARQLSLSGLAHSSASGERKRGAGSIDVNYADVTREGAHWSVSPPKESIKVRQLVFSP